MNANVLALKRDKGNHLRKPPGMALATDYNVGQKEIAQASWQNRDRNLADPNEDPLRGLIKHGILDLDRKVKSDVLPYFLPVSFSEHGQLTEWDDIIELQPGSQDVNRNFPCISGDWTSNETPDFMKRLGYGKQGKDYVSGMANDLIEQMCKCVSYLYSFQLQPRLFRQPPSGRRPNSKL